MQQIAVNKNFNLDFFFRLSFLLYFSSVLINSEQSFIFEFIFYIITIIYFIFNLEKVKLTYFLIWGILFFMISLITVTGTFSPEQSFIELRKLIRIAIVGNSIIAYIVNKEDLVSIFKVLIYSGLVLFTFMIIEIPSHLWFETRLGGSEFGLNANAVGLTLSISAIIALFLAKYRSVKLYYLPIPIFILAVFLTGSRKSIVLILAGIAGILYFNSEGVTKKIKFFIFSILILILAYMALMNIPFLYEITGQRIEALILSLWDSSSGDGSTRIRAMMIDTGKNLFFHRPISGYGIGSFAEISGFNTYAHNNFVELLVGVGIFGAVIYYSLYAYVIYFMIKLRHNKIITPLLVLMLLLTILEIGLVTYNEIEYQIIPILAFAAIRVVKKAT